MIFFILYIFSVIVALGLGGLAAWSDYKGMTIPNIVPLGIALAFLAGYGVSVFGGAEVFSGWQSHLAAGGIVLVVTFIMYALRLIGGGDSKLVAAFALWVGLRELMTLLFYMALLGAFLGLGALLIKKFRPFKNVPEGSWIQRLQAGEGVVAYGIPISFGATVAFWKMGLLSPATLQLFLITN